MRGAEEQDPRVLFGAYPRTLAICRRVEQVIATIGADVSVNVTKSQVAFRNRRAFAWVWRPGQYVNNPMPAVLSIALARELDSDRIKSVVHPSPKVWMHHIELDVADLVDAEVRDWLGEAYANAR